MFSIHWRCAMDLMRPHSFQVAFFCSSNLDFFVLFLVTFGSFVIYSRTTSKIQSMHSKCNRWSTALYFRHYNGHQSRFANHFRLEINFFLVCSSRCFSFLSLCVPFLFLYSNSKCHARLPNFDSSTCVCVCDLCASKLFQTVRLYVAAIFNYVH